MKFAFGKAHRNSWEEPLDRTISPMTWFEGISKHKFKMERPIRRRVSPEMFRPRKLECPSVFMANGNFTSRSTKTIRVKQETAKKNTTQKRNLPAHSSFQRAIGSILITGQLFGLMPLYGVLSSTPGSLQFKIWSFRTFYTFVVVVCLFVVEAISVHHMLYTLTAETLGVLGGIGAATACAMFYGNALVGTLLFLRLASKWPMLLSSWNNMELVLDRSRQPASPISLKFSLLTALVLLLALGEHILSVISNVPVFLEKHWTSHSAPPTALPALTTSVTSSSTATLLLTTKAVTTATTPVNQQNVITEFLTEYCQKSNACLFRWVTYNTGYGIAIFIISKIATFTWNFTDLFLVLISTGLTERFNQFNKALLRINHLEVSAEEWGEYRTYFSTLSAHCKSVDNYISAIVFASFANNLYFICLQLLNGLNPTLTNLIDRLYFFYSFAFLLGRTILVTLFAAQINFSSKKALYVLFNCPPKAYTIEAQRLQYQMSADDISLSGMGFFSITRNFMLSVAAAIATYEIVLLQFNAVAHEDSTHTSMNATAHHVLTKS